VPAATAEVRALRVHGGDRRSDEFQGNNSNLEIKRGNASSYLTARLKRDAPQVAEDLANGKYRSVRAAAKEAAEDTGDTR
jgi:hypothetical protein